jgi:hypothetical protein
MLKELAVASEAERIEHRGVEGLGISLQGDVAGEDGGFFGQTLAPSPLE